MPTTSSLMRKAVFRAASTSTRQLSMALGGGRAGVLAMADALDDAVVVAATGHATSSACLLHNKYCTYVPSIVEHCRFAGHAKVMNE